MKRGKRDDGMDEGQLGEWNVRVSVAGVYDCVCTLYGVVHVVETETARERDMTCVTSVRYWGG